MFDFKACVLISRKKNFVSFSLSVRMWVCVRVWVLVQVFGVGCFDGICISRRRCHECFLFMCISSRLTLPSWSKRLLCIISFPIAAFFSWLFAPFPHFLLMGGGVYWRIYCPTSLVLWFWRIPWSATSDCSVPITLHPLLRSFGRHVVTVLTTSLRRVR